MITKKDIKQTSDKVYFLYTKADDAGLVKETKILEEIIYLLSNAELNLRLGAYKEAETVYECAKDLMARSECRMQEIKNML